MSLDTELVMELDRRQGSEWCRREGIDLASPDEIVACPYAVLEVKLGVPEPPDYVTEILKVTDALIMPKFSKFQNGMATLYPEAAGELPYWFDDVWSTQFIQSLELGGRATRLEAQSTVIPEYKSPAIQRANPPQLVPAPHMQKGEKPAVAHTPSKLGPNYEANSRTVVAAPAAADRQPVPAYISPCIFSKKKLHIF